MVAQKWLRWSDNGKIFNNNNSGEFVLFPLTGNWHQNSPDFFLLKFLPLSDHRSHFWATTIDFTTYFMLLVCMGCNFFYSLAVLCRFHFLL